MSNVTISDIHAMNRSGEKIFGVFAWDPRVTTISHNIVALDRVPDAYANVARTIDDTLAACAGDVRAARRIMGQHGRT